MNLKTKTKKLLGSVLGTNILFWFLWSFSEITKDSCLSSFIWAVGLIVGIILTPCSLFYLYDKLDVEKNYNKWLDEE